ncbi:hypothetical protein Golax_003538 [Gossypium laxum]|uniref:CXXC motif containing zinc binding protein n=2 Tax=Gossypium TaxID=3633 RepID=A0A7J8MUD9_9ROSI|nr:hypothetical protein [Gossypium lobatum]MBA0722904.1 hypothetical protein [Gossypium laxum]
MVNFMLKISADLENLTNLQPQGGCDDPSFPYLFKVSLSFCFFACFFDFDFLPLNSAAADLKCGRCGELSQKETCVSLGDTVPLLQGKGTTNLVQKCKFCMREGTVTMIPGKGRPLTQEDCEGGKFAPLMLFDCRGYEPVGFVFGVGWKVESLEGTKFEGIDLSGDDFSEYDEKGECPVMISNLRSTFEPVK